MSDTTAPSGEQPQLHPSQRFVVVRMKRSDLKKAAYNPRKIDPLAKKKLRTKLEDPEIGLLYPIVFNKRTGNLLGGHQRLSCLDLIAPKKEYLLDISVVDLDPKREREMNVFLNNPSVQGFFDTLLLEVGVKTGELDLIQGGFEPFDLQTMFDDEALSSMFSGGLETPEAKKATKTAQQAADEIAEIKKRRKEYKAGDMGENDGRFLVVLVFDNSEEKGKLLKLFGWSPEVQYFDGRRILAAVEVATSKEGG